MSGHPFVHIDISAKDPAAASKFYAELCGWKVEHDPQFNYYMYSAEGGPGGGWVQADGKTYNAGDIIPYIEADDIEAMLKRVVELGGKVLLGKTEIPQVGWFAFFADPTGNRLGLYKDMNPHS